MTKWKKIKSTSETNATLKCQIWYDVKILFDLRSKKPQGLCVDSTNIQFRHENLLKMSK